MREHTTVTIAAITVARISEEYLAALARAAAHLSRLHGDARRRPKLKETYEDALARAVAHSATRPGPRTVTAGVTGSGHSPEVRSGRSVAWPALREPAAYRRFGGRRTSRGWECWRCRKCPGQMHTTNCDDTAVCSLAVGEHPWTLFGNNDERMIALRDGEGRFPTWMVPRYATSWFRNDYDGVVNANVLAYLGKRPETAGAERWVEELIEQGEPDTALVHYADALDLYAAAARASVLGRPVLERARPAVAASHRLA